MVADTYISAIDSVQQIMEEEARTLLSSHRLIDCNLNGFFFFLFCPILSCNMMKRIRKSIKKRVFAQYNIHELATSPSEFMNKTFGRTYKMLKDMND
jgi:hypothetical protein